MNSSVKVVIVIILLLVIRFIIFVVHTIKVDDYMSSAGYIFERIYKDDRLNSMSVNGVWKKPYLDENTGEIDYIVVQMSKLDYMSIDEIKEKYR